MEGTQRVACYEKEGMCDASQENGQAQLQAPCIENRRKRISRNQPGLPVVLEDANLILPGLYLGSYKATEDEAKLKEQGITHILIAAANIQPKFPTEFSYLVLHEVLDTEEQDIMSHFGDCLAFIREARDQGGSVLVVCMVGMSRSASVVIAFVMDELKLCAEDAYCLVKRARSKVCPNPSFAQQLRLFHVLRDMFLPGDSEDTQGEHEREEAEEPEKVAQKREADTKTAEDARVRATISGDTENHTRTAPVDDALIQRQRAEQDYTMVRHISHMYHSAHKLSREGRIPAECFGKDPHKLEEPRTERAFSCAQCSRRLFGHSNVLPHKKKRPTIACNVMFIQPLEWMIAQHENRKNEEEIPSIGDDQEESRRKSEADKNSRVRYLSSFHAPPNGDHLEFISKERLGGLQKVFGELRCPACDHKVGYWNWMGNGCYCGQRMMPAFCIERKHVADSSSTSVEGGSHQDALQESAQRVQPQKHQETAEQQHQAANPQ